MARVICPFCEKEIKLPEQLKIGQTVSCSYCAEKLIVMQLNPVVLEWPDGDDWEDDEVAWKSKPMKINSKRVYDPRDAGWYEDADWGGGRADVKIREKRPRKKSFDSQREARRRHYRRDESFQDF